MTNYVSCVESAKLIRKVLKESFAGVKFSVKCQHHTTVSVSWTDGPTQGQVDNVLNVFVGSYFDGMQDYQGTRYAMLDGVRTSFMSNYVRTNRDYSDETVQKSIDATFIKFKKNYEVAEIEKLNVEEYRSGKYLHIVDPAMHNCGGESVHNDIRNNMSKRSYVMTAESKTLARISYIGDDGYGIGSDGEKNRLKIVK